MSAADTEKNASTTVGNKSEETASPFTPYRIFMNEVDDFNTKHIASYIADLYYGEKKAEDYLPIAGEGAESPDDEAFKMDIEDSRHKYEIIGTARSPFSKKLEDVMYVLDEMGENFREEIDNCGVVIYDITRNPAVIPKALDTLKFLNHQLDEIKEIGPKTYSNYSDTKIFILITTIMTWTRTKMPAREAPGGPFVDSHYRRRRPHPAYKDHLACEKEVMMLGKKHKKKLKTYVLATGFTYGHEEDNLDFLFKMAWLNRQHLPIFGDGSNFIPLIHVTDLAKIIAALIKDPIAKKRYILAVEPFPSRLKNIVTAITRAMGQGFVKEVESLEEALTFEGITEKMYELFTINLRMKPLIVLENFEIEWQYDSGFVKNIARIIDELKKSRELSTVKVMIHGPPSSGKTILAKRICEEYGLRYVSIKTMIEETLEGLRNNITEEKLRIQLKAERKAKKQEEEKEEEEEAEEEEEEEEAEEEEEEGADIEEWEEQIRDIQAALSESENNKLPDGQVTKLLRVFLNSNLCQNIGFVLDGYPKITYQAEDLFGHLGGDEEEEAFGEGIGDDYEDRVAAIANSKIMPKHVFSLCAPDEFLCDRVKKLQEKDIEGTHYTEEHMKRRLEIYRSTNNEDDTVLNYFDELEIHPVLYDATKDDTENMDSIYDAIKQQLGDPISFGLSFEEQLDFFKEQERQLEQKIHDLAEQKRARQEEALENYKLKMSRWTETLETLKIEEEKVIVAESEPLRSYLMEFIFPTLTKALIEVAKIKPDDPVDFVAEYLFKINPEGKLFDPTFSQKGQELLDYCHNALDSMYKIT